MTQLFEQPPLFGVQSQALKPILLSRKIVRFFQLQASEYSRVASCTRRDGAFCTSRRKNLNLARVQANNLHVLKFLAFGTTFDLLEYARGLGFNIARCLKLRIPAQFGYARGGGIGHRSSSVV